jgi:peptide/nickel transport system permease protein
MTAADPDTALPLDPAARVPEALVPGRWRRFARNLRNFARRSPLSAFWGCIAAAIIVIAIAAPLIAPYPPLKSDFRAMTKPPAAPHYFGTDQIGRDTLSRVIYGSRASLAVAIGAVLFGTTLGSLWGLASGYFGGRFDIVSQRIIEFLQSFPDLILAMAIAMALGAGFGTVIVAIAITRIPFGGRVIRAVVLSLKEMSYVEAARGLGASHLRMMARHILPQCIAPYLILATTHLGVAIIIEASLGFLGVGIPPPTPTWGNMLADSLNAGLVPPWWLVLFPGCAITLTVLAFSLLGDGIRDLVDPRLRGAVSVRGKGAAL